MTEEAFNKLQDELTRVRAQAVDLQKQLAAALDGKVLETQIADPSAIWVETILSHRTHTGMVNLRWGNLSAQLSPMQTRTHALNLLAIADAADMEAALYQFIVGSGAPRKMALGVLAQWRAFREERSVVECPDPETQNETPTKH
jgi:hypothetical protein